MECSFSAHVLATRSDADMLDLDPDKLLNELNILPSFDGELIPRSGLGSRRRPAREYPINRLHTLEYGKIGCRAVSRTNPGESGGTMVLTWERFELLAVYAVADGNFDLFETIQDVKLGQVQASVMVDGGRVFYDHKIEPPASTSSSSCNTDFTTDILEVITNFLYSSITCQSN